MFLVETLQLAFQTLRANKMRAILTLLGISIGVGAVIALISIGTGVRRYVTDQFTSAGTNLILVSPGRMQRGMSGGVFAQPAQLTMSDWRAVSSMRKSPKGTTSRLKRPSAMARSARSWLSFANTSISSREMFQ